MNLTNQRPATTILTNGITWREIRFEFWTNEITIRFLLTQVTAFHTKVDANPYDTSANSTDIVAFAGTCSGTDLAALKLLATKLTALTKMIDAGITSLQGQNTSKV